MLHLKNLSNDKKEEIMSLMELVLWGSHSEEAYIKLREMLCSTQQWIYPDKFTLEIIKDSFKKGSE